MAETLQTRVTRLEKAMVRLANAQAHLTEVLAENQTDTNDRLEQMKLEAQEREKRIDERIEKLVLAIAELVRRNGGR